MKKKKEHLFLEGVRGKGRLGQFNKIKKYVWKFLLLFDIACL